MLPVKSATITLKKSNATDVVARSLHPETIREISRTKVAIKEDESSYYIHISAQDSSSLRAALNSYLRWMKVTEDTYREIKKSER
jgi:KEOPS complex subunit Pcc1